MKYSNRPESFSPSKASLELIEKSVQVIFPDQTIHQQWYSNYSKNQGIRLAFDIDHVLHYIPRGSKVLEIGSVPLILTSAIRQLGYDIQGLDINPERFQSAILAQKLSIQQLNIETENLPFLENSFDAVIFNELFEHLRINLIFTMQEVCRVLKPNGIMLLSTPNLLSLKSIKSLFMYGKGVADIYTEYSKIQRVGHMGHVRLYTVREIDEFLAKVGFETIEVVYRGSSKEPGLYGSLENHLFRIFPQLRPSFSIITKKRPQ